MSWRALPPAGDPIALSGDATTLPEFAGYRAIWVHSGTAALSLALSLARQRHPGIAHPEVILPGYGCPDLVAAAVYAGVRPVLADIGAQDPGYDSESLRSALSPNTVAVVAVNFLGIRERLTELRELLSDSPQVALIEDDAQWFPEPTAAAPVMGDALSLSFGRGKPVSLLGGGALFVGESFAPDIPIRIEPAVDPGKWLHWKMRIYNSLLNPVFYGAASRVFRLGRTVFKPLDVIAALDPQRLALLPSNVERHLQRPQTVATRIRALLPKAMDLPGGLEGRCGRLLRYPVLCADAAQRNALWKKLRLAGLGASAMYQHPLLDIEHVAQYVTVRGDLPGARRFANSLLTLPVHTKVDAASLRKMARILAGRI